MFAVVALLVEPDRAPLYQPPKKEAPEPKDDAPPPKALAKKRKSLPGPHSIPVPDTSSKLAHSRSGSGSIKVCVL